MGSKRNNHKIVAFNDLMSRVLSVVCVAWIILWTVAGVNWIVQKQYVGLYPVFLYGSPAIIYLAFRYKKYRDKATQNIQVK